MKKYPVGVRLLLAFYCIGLFVVIVSVAGVLTGIVPLDAEGQAYFAALGPIDFVISGIALVLTLCATVALFKMKSISITLFGLELILSILQTAYEVYRGIAKTATTDCIGYALTLGILYYLVTLRKKGTLT